MNRITQLWRTSTVRLTATFLLIFVVFSILLLAFITYQSSVLLQRQQQSDIETEVVLLQRLDSARGLPALVLTVNRLASQPGAGLYYLGDAFGRTLVSNISDFPAYVLESEGVHSFNYDRIRPFDALDEPAGESGGFAVVQTLTLANSGLRLMVGRDIVERREFTAIVFRAFFLGVVGILVLSLIAGGITARRVLRRIDTITGTSTKIMSGNLSERIPVTRRNDEFDALATSLNAMLERIERLLQGLKEVTDNVAHDLKTPLTRLRNRAEAALRQGSSDDTRRQALATTLEESDKLIRTFNALLMIARAEAGAPSGAFADVDVSATVSDIAELYGPVVEEQQLTLEAEIASGIRLRANRELITQALVNLIENAMKYFDRGLGREGRIRLAARQLRGRVLIEVADNGPGIPDADRKRALERFVRLEASRTEPGSGLGLSLVAAVARLHGGDFRLEDNAPGVRAVMDLPAAT